MSKRIVEFALFPRSLWRPNFAITTTQKDPWAARDAWRKHPMFDLSQRRRLMLPGVGLGLVSFALFVAYDQWYYSRGPGAAETKHWKEWAEQRAHRMGDHHHH